MSCKGNIFINEGRALLADFGEAHSATPMDNLKDRRGLFYHILIPAIRGRTSGEIARLRAIVDNTQVEGDDNQLLTTAIDTLKQKNEWLLD